MFKRFIVFVVLMTFGSHALRLTTKNSQLYYSFLNDDCKKLVIGHGVAGSGKTFIASNYALSGQKQRKVILTKPLKTVAEENIGFLPGDISEKICPWIKSFLIGQKVNNKYEFIPLGFMRGLTFHNSIILADEMQNSSPEQMYMLLTRLGENSKIIIMGDIEQKDINTKSGLEDLLERLNNCNDNQIAIVEFLNNDIERSNFVQTISNLYKPLNFLEVEIEEEVKKPSTIELYCQLIKGREDNTDSAMIPLR